MQCCVEFYKYYVVGVKSVEDEQVAQAGLTAWEERTTRPA